MQVGLKAIQEEGVTNFYALERRNPLNKMDWHEEGSASDIELVHKMLAMQVKHNKKYGFIGYEFRIVRIQVSTTREILGQQ